MNEGWVSNRLGVQGAPNSAEETMVARDISLAELTGGHVHLAHISTIGTLDLVRRAKDAGIRVTCEVTPHHLTLTDEAVMGGQGGSPFAPLGEDAYDTYAKVNPPLRARPDMNAMAQGLAAGLIDIIATDHAPHGRVEKLCTFEEAAMGISVLETALGSVLSLVHAGHITPTLDHRKADLRPRRPARTLRYRNPPSRLRGGRDHLRPGRRLGCRYRGVRVEGQEFAAAWRDAEG